MLNKLRINLTILNTIVLVVILSIISVFVYVLMDFNLHKDIDDILITNSHQVDNYINFIEDNKFNDQVDEEKKNEHLRSIHNMTKNNISYVLLDTEKGVNINSSYLELDYKLLMGIRKDAMNDGEGFDRIINDLNRAFYFTTVNIEGINYRICTTYYSTDMQKNNVRTIQTIKTLRNEKDVLNRLGFTLIATIIIGTSLSLIGGYILAGRSLIPIIKSWQRQQEFVSDASHELRTPLAVVQTNLEVVKGSQNETVKSQSYWLDNAYDETLRMNKIIEDLLFLARADSGQKILEKEKLDLSFLLMDVCEKLIPIAANKQLQIIANVDENLSIWGDGNKIRQLMFILIDNAINYSSPNKVIRVLAKEVKNGALIEVIDQGIGISHKDLNRVFDRFYRADKARSREQGGTGLGLSIAKWIVDIHKGRIDIESKEQEGTKVVAFLPFN
ncbi:MAG TPA: sensor histidine kinase [Eubacteriaceae bacterium]|nr:sensor histidine kinase [Eubacteriaceae bacterium]